MHTCSGRVVGAAFQHPRPARLATELAGREPPFAMLWAIIGRRGKVSGPRVNEIALQIVRRTREVVPRPPRTLRAGEPETARLLVLHLEAGLPADHPLIHR
jgi:hypothetical protein